MSITGIVITKNEEKMISDCLKSLQFVDQLIVVDTGNTDSTNQIARKFHAQIVVSSGSDYSQWRNDGIKKAVGEWIFFLDADERVSKELEAELVSQDPNYSAYEIPRLNLFLKKEMKFGGWGNDSVIRLFHKSSKVVYKNSLHEQPYYVGNLGKLSGKIIHHSHRGLYSMLNKTLIYTNHEAKLLFAANHPPVEPWRIIRVMLTEFWKRFVVLSAWRDGPEGIIDGLFQVYNSFVIYSRLWEMQKNAKSSNLQS